MKDRTDEEWGEYLKSSICWPTYWFWVRVYVRECVCLCFCACVPSWDLPGCCLHIWQTPLKVFSPRCLSVSAPSLLPEWESLPSRPHLSSRPPKASAFPKLLYTGAPQAPCYTTGNTPKNPQAPQTVEQQLCTRELARGEGGMLSGNTTKNMLHLAFEQSLTAPPVGVALFLHTGLLVTPLSFLSGALTLLAIPQGSSRPPCATCALTFAAPGG